MPPNGVKQALKKGQAGIVLRLDVSVSALAGRTSLQWALRDANGTPVANGIYYVRIQVMGTDKTVKILKLLVTR